MNERIRKGVVTGAVTAIATYGLAGCGGESQELNQESNKMSACPQWWGGESNRIGFGVTQSEAHAALQRATSELLSKLEVKPQSGADVRYMSADIPAEYVDATTQLFDIDGSYFQLTDRKLNQPAAEFCIDDAYLQYKTPAYIAAEQALEVAGIQVGPEVR